MKIPKRLQPLVHDGLIEAVLRSLMSGKEASVFVVQSEGEIRCAKVYKEATKRNFKQRADYQEGRNVRNSRRARAMAKRSKFGKAELEEAWQSTEVDTIYKLARLGLRVPQPYMFADGVLVMELVVDADGQPAPRLNDIRLSADKARRYHAFMLDQVVRMLCAGLIHGDLSEYNVLVGPDGPVIIDFPQAVDAAANQNAKRMLLRDVNNMRAYFGRFARELKSSNYGKEIWKLYERGELHPGIELSGLVEEETKKADVSGVLGDIEDAREEHHRRFGRKVVDVTPPPKKAAKSRPARAGSKAKAQSVEGPSSGAKRRRRRKKPKTPDTQANHAKLNQGASEAGRSADASSHDPKAPPKRKRRRRSRAKGRAPESAAIAATPQAQTQDAPPKARRRRRRRKRSEDSQQAPPAL